MVLSEISAIDHFYTNVSTNGQSPRGILNLLRQTRSKIKGREGSGAMFARLLKGGECWKNDPREGSILSVQVGISNRILYEVLLTLFSFRVDTYASV